MGRVRRTGILTLAAALAIGACSTGDKDLALREHPGGIPDLTGEQTRRAQTMLMIINEYRIQKGLPGLVLERHLMRAAQWQSEDQAQTAGLSHDSTTGRKLGDRVSAVGYEYRMTGETLSRGSSDVQKTFEGWLSSPPHYKVLTHEKYVHAGIGFSWSTQRGVKEPVWAVVVGRPLQRMWDRTMVIGFEEARPGKDKQL
ncbi:MAG: CAP domain-containing protein [Rhodospirillaceae bacterium]|nr:CAP domain-containing protein [Rhodospirillaceae bacterium]